MRDPFGLFGEEAEAPPPLAESNPAQTIHELSLIDTLFAENSSDLDDDTQQRLDACLELARRQKGVLEAKVIKQSQIDITTVQNRLDLAEVLHESNPNQAKKIVRAVVNLYHDKPWAAPIVIRAEALLAEWQ